MLTLQRLTPLLTRNILCKSFSNSSHAVHALNDKLTENASKTENVIKKAGGNPKHTIVAAAFASLKDQSIVADPFTIDDEHKISIDEKIMNAKTVTGLLKVSETSNVISRNQALKIVSILAEWSTINQAKLSDFENDPRFIKLCRILGRTPKINNNINNNNSNKITGFRTDDLSTVLGVTGDDEAAKLIASISLPQMVKVMSTLAQKKRRSTPLLRSLAYNISSNSTILDLKQCADLLYSMAKLNYPDPILVGRICTDLYSGLLKNDKPAVIGSIITSLGMLKYRDLDALEALSEWVLKHQDKSRPQDISALFLTLATLNYKTTKITQLKDGLADLLSDVDLKKTTDWLDHVWALVVLGFAKSHQIKSVLQTNYISKLTSDVGELLTPTIKMKLLNINAAAKYLYADYNGPFLENATLFEVPLVHSKPKQVLVGGMLDALKTLISNHDNIQTNVDSKMGYVIDAICVFDLKGNPVAGNKIPENAIKIAIMVQDYHDLCHGSHSIPTGINSLALQLLEKNNYKILSIPYSEFNTSEKLLKRVQYLESKLKKLLITK